MVMEARSDVGLDRSRRRNTAVVGTTGLNRAGSSTSLNRATVHIGEVALDIVLLKPVAKLVDGATPVEAGNWEKNSVKLAPVSIVHVHVCVSMSRPHLSPDQE